MANRFQKIIYYTSAMSPIGIVFSLVWFFQNNTYIIPVIITVISLLLVVAFVISFEYGKKNISPMSIRVTDVATNDIWVLSYVISYLLPLASMLIAEWNVYVLTIIAILGGVVMIFMNCAIPHPLLAVRKYHFYQLTTENGISSYILISKRCIRNKNEIKTVGRWFEFLLIEK
ncbi:MAG: hypothetical protein IKW08_03180 [Roseburia sp.]|nr:hypothetical protein [Roseburia sp.]